MNEMADKINWNPLGDVIGPEDDGHYTQNQIDKLLEQGKREENPHDSLTEDEVDKTEDTSVPRIKGVYRKEGGLYRKFRESESVIVRRGKGNPPLIKDKKRIIERSQIRNLGRDEETGEERLIGLKRKIGEIQIARGPRPRLEEDYALFDFDYNKGFRNISSFFPIVFDAMLLKGEQELANYPLYALLTKDGENNRLHVVYRDVKGRFGFLPNEFYESDDKGGYSRELEQRLPSVLKSVPTFIAQGNLVDLCIDALGDRSFKRDSLGDLSHKKERRD